MVEVATKKEFDAFKKLIEDRLDNMDDRERKSMDARVKLFAAINTRLGAVDEDLVAIHKRITDVEAKSKSFFTRIKEAIEPVDPE